MSRSTLRSGVSSASSPVLAVISILLLSGFFNTTPQVHLLDILNGSWTPFQGRGNLFARFVMKCRDCEDRLVGAMGAGSGLRVLVPWTNRREQLLGFPIF